MNKSCGIYKITSPSGKIYIGQAVNIINRWNRYKNPNNTKSQKKLKNSFEKYGVENHYFDIIEYCDRSQLNCSERFWQDEFNVLGKNGLNCVLQDCGGKMKVLSKDMTDKATLTKITNGTIRSGGENHKSKITLCLQTGIFYDCLKDACRALGLNYDNTRGKVRDNRFKYLVYIDNFDEDISVRHGRTTELIKTVKDISSGIIYKSVHDASRALNIPWSNLSKMLKGQVENKTSLIYLGGEVKSHKRKHKETPVNAKEVLCLTTGIYYPSLRESCTAMNIKYGTAQVYMRKNKIPCLVYV